MPGVVLRYLAHIVEPKTQKKRSPVQADRQTKNKEHNRKVNYTVFSKVASAKQRKAEPGKGREGLGLGVHRASSYMGNPIEPH